MMKVGQKFPLRDKQLREQQKQAWIEHEEDRKRKYVDFQQKAKQKPDVARYNEVLSAKSKLQREHELLFKKSQHSASGRVDTKKPITADQPDARRKHGAKDSTVSGGPRLDDQIPTFRGDYVTLTKDQLKILLDAAEGAKNRNLAEDRGYSNNYTNSSDTKSAGIKREVAYGEPHIVSIEPDSVYGLHQLPPHNESDHVPHPPASLADRKRQQWAEEKEELSQHVRDAAAAVVNKAPTKNSQLPVYGEPGAAALVSEMLSESLRAKKLRQWEVEQKLASGGKGSLAQIGQQDEPKHARIRAEPEEYSTAPPSLRQEAKKLSLVEKKKQQWETERGISKEGSVIEDWFGKPGAGAPIRSEEGDVLTQYGARGGEAKNIQESLAKHYPTSKPPSERQNIPVFTGDLSSYMPNSVKNSGRNAVVVEPGRATDAEIPPAAMRSAFSSGGTVADDRKFQDVKERERQAWLDDLKRQIEEKQAQKAKERQTLEAYYRDDPVGQNHPESVRGNASKPGDKHIFKVEYDKKRQIETDPKYWSFPPQVEGIETERARIKKRQKEAVDNATRLAQALAHAELEAQRSKLLKRIEKLRAGGHDTRGLERTYKELLTPRGVPSLAMTGLANDQDDDVPLTVQHQATRILTPTERRSNRNVQQTEQSYRQAEKEYQPSTDRESCAVQTEDFVFASGKRLQDILREQSKLEIEYRDSRMGHRNQQGATAGAAKKQPQQKVTIKENSKNPVQQNMAKRPVETKKSAPEPRAKPGEKKPWAYQNVKNRPALKASDREVAIGSAEKRDREARRKDRAMQMIALAEANMAKSRLLAGGNLEHGRLVHVESDRKELRRPRSRSNQRNQPQNQVSRQRHVSPPADLPSSRFQSYEQPSGRGMPPPPQRQQGPAEAEFLPYRRSSGKLERDELPANYDAMVDTTSHIQDANGAQKGELMRQHLQFLRQGLLRRQQELERSMTPNTLSEVRASQQYRQ